MLRITIHEDANGPTIELEGKFAGPWVEEVNRAWHSLAPLEGSKRLRIDIRKVAFADAKGRELLRRIHRETKARILADTPLAEMYAAEAQHRSGKNGKGGKHNARS
jgi:hypothetical protein